MLSLFSPMLVSSIKHLTFLKAIHLYTDNKWWGRRDARLTFIADSVPGPAPVHLNGVLYHLCDSVSLLEFVCGGDDKGPFYLRQIQILQCSVLIHREQTCKSSSSPTVPGDYPSFPAVVGEERLLWVLIHQASLSYISTDQSLAKE